MTTFETYLIGFRHELHQHPEISKQEFETTRRIREQLIAHNIDTLPLSMPTGIIAEIKGDLPGPVIALRGDIDALPIEEESNISFRSLNKGAMHACGHDLHTTVLLGAAIRLSQLKDKIKGTIRFIFQPGEEIAYGAAEMLKTHLLDDVSAIFGWHNDPELPIGTVASAHGPVTASVDAFDIKITGKGSHAAKPNEGNDPFIIAAQVLTAFQTIISRYLPSQTNAVVSITQMHGGNNRNVIPETVSLSGTVRAFDPAIVETIKKRMSQILAGLAVTNDAKIDLEWVEEFSPATNNNPELTDFATLVASESGFSTTSMSPLSIGEDFANFQRQIPGAFVFIGSGGPYALHHPKFEADDKILLPIVNYFTSLALQAPNFIANK